jgi:hypothetical protein
MYLPSKLVLIIPPGLLSLSTIIKSEVFLDKKFAALKPEIPPPIITVCVFKVLV